MKTKLLLFIFFVFVSFDNISAQPTIQWQKCLGGSGSEDANAIQQTTDGGYIVAGSSSSSDGDVTGNHGYDYWVVKLNSTGNIQWQKCLGGSGFEHAYDVQQTTDGGYIVAGNSFSTNGDVTGNHGGNFYDFWIVKLDSAGNIQWQKSLGGSQDDEAYAVQQTTDGGYIVTGSSNSNNGDVTGHHGGTSTTSEDFWIVKLNSTGNIQWQKSLGGAGRDNPQSIQKTMDGGYIVAGTSDSTDGDVTGNHGRNDYWIVKLSNSGNIQWQKSFGGSGDDDQYSIQQTTDGGYIIGGFSSSSTNGDVTGNHGIWDHWIVKIDSAGSIQWQKCLGGSGNEGSYSGTAIQQTSDGGYIVAGSSASTNGDVTGNHGEEDYWVVKLSSTGNIQWQKSYGGSDIDFPGAIHQTTDGGYIVGGRTRSTDGDVTGNHGFYDSWIVKLSANVDIAELSAEENSFSFYPNPCANRFTLSFNKVISNASLKIHNLLGEEVYNETIDSKQAIINTNLSSGIYFVKVTDNEKEYVQKLIVE